MAVFALFVTSTYGLLAAFLFLMWFSHFNVPTCREACAFPFIPDHMPAGLLLGVRQGGSTQTPLLPDEIIVNTTVSQSEETELTFNNFTLPAKYRKKRDRKRPWRAKALYMHIEFTLAGQVLRHYAYPLLRPCDNALQSTRNLLSTNDRCGGGGCQKATPKKAEAVPMDVGAAPVDDSRDEDALQEVGASDDSTGWCWVHKATIMYLISPEGGISRQHPPQGISPQELTTSHRYLGYDFFAPIATVDDETLPLFRLGPLGTNTGRPTPNATVIIYPISVGWFGLHRQLKGAINVYRDLGFDQTFIDMMLDTFSYYGVRARIIEFVLSYCHSFLAMFAFRNDVAFFSQKKIPRGLSKWSVIGSTVQSIVTLLYLYDQPTIHISVVILHGIETIIAIWKVVRTLLASKSAKDDAAAASDGKEGEKAKGEKSLDEKCAEYDATAMKNVGSVCAVFFSVYLAYTLKEMEHRSWWSWFITSAAHASYTWGFVLMTPQLYVNYKLKSVAHLPWRSMVYKAFSTFVDDAYAFFIPNVPMAYRLACARDDVVFILLLVQLWWYPTDKTRVNEYGQQFEKPDADAEKDAIKEEEATSGRSTPSSAEEE